MKIIEERETQKTYKKQRQKRTRRMEAIVKG